ncbi:MAG TPA: aldehyde dehydrogenase family protein [Solirubrobacteraceae bacterium]|jgi:succinate-semialdehyde dehydrogenase/glutarate-semialdehyde dehydrogenase
MAAAVQESIEPATGATLGTVPVTAPGDVERAVAEAAAVQPLWAQLRLEDRARYLRRAAQALIDERVDLVRLIAREQGRPVAEAELMEVLPAIETLLWLAEHGARTLGDHRVGLSRTFFLRKRVRVTHEPLGVIAVITPAAEPLAVPMGDVAFALLGGNGVVLKPAPRACLCGERIARAFALAGLPEGLLQVVHGGSATARALVEAPVAHVRLTGSVEMGRVVGELSARALRPATLALSGKDAMLVLADAPLERAIAGAAWAGFANAGQSGGSVERVFVARELYDRFLAGVIARATALTVGDPLDPATEVGPLTSVDRVSRVRALVDDAVERGAVQHCGGARGAEWFAPAVLSGVPPDAALALQEVPGPVLSVDAVDSVEEAVERANAGAFGLGASVWTTDRAAGTRIARGLRAGMVWMNDHQVSAMAPQLPWGGVKDSGLGRTRGEAALLECVSDKVVTWDMPHGRPLWWHPYDRTLLRAGEALTLLRSVRDRDRSRAWKEGTVPLARLAWRALRRP